MVEEENRMAIVKANNNKIKRSRGEKIFDCFNIIFMLFMMAICLYPFWYVICASISKSTLFMSHTGFLLKPLGYSIASYKNVFQNQRIWIGYANTIFYVVVGTAMNIFMTILGAYFMSRRDVPGKKFIIMLVVFTMYFSGGMIPAFLNIQSLGLFDTRWAILLPGLINTSNLIIMRTAMQAIDVSMEEAAMIDGATHIDILFRVMIPLVKPTLAVLVLYYGVSHWNSWFSAMIYLDNPNKEPLQLVLRQILIINDMTDMSVGEDVELISETIKYATIVVSTLPILALYPFLQKYFNKGIMIGALKG